ncbi:MAG: carbohydrate ABC transporter substrate-binding protein [Clostridia bacterium]|nr:carbohydrate ABC transporter substrate-binding protein [Clostridia bacterium]
MKTRRLLTLLPLALLVLLCSCRKTADPAAGTVPDNGGSVSETEETGPRILSNIYQGEGFPVPEGENMETFVQPEWDGETLWYVSVRYIREKDAEGNAAIRREWSLVQSSYTEVLTQIPLDLPEGAILPGMIRDGELIAGVQQQSNGQLIDFAVFRKQITTGEERISPSLKPYFGDQGSIQSMAFDRYGRLYLATDYRIVIFGEDFGHLESIDFNSKELSITASANGSVIAYDQSHVYRIDPETLAIAEEMPFNAYQITDGTLGFDFCALRDGGVWGIRADWQAGTLEEELLLDRDASDLTDMYITLLCPVGDDGFAYYREEMTATTMNFYPMIFTPVPDIDLSGVTVLHVATTALPSEVINTAIGEFNRNHTDVRIEMTEYRGGDLASEDERLAREIVTGTFVPDIVIGDAESVSVRQMAEKKLYADLMPYLRSDSLVKESNLFGIVKHMFDDGRGGLWGITTNVNLKHTLISTPSLLGEYASKGGWTIPEFLDYAESLSPDTELLYNLTQANVEDLLFAADGYAYFIDAEKGTCSFDGEDFVRFLRFMRALPTEEEYRRTEWGAIDADELMRWRMEEGIALVRIQSDPIGHYPILAHGTKDWIMIGYPAAESRAGAGTPVTVGTVFVVSSACQNKGAAWEFIRSCFTDKEGQGGAPVLKSLFRSMAEPYYDFAFIDYFSFHAETGYGSYGPRDPEHPATTDDLPYPGIVSDYTASDEAKMEAILDSLGRPLLEVWRTDVKEIIREELSAYLAGVGTPEDCAKKIQSRVSIWLAERS